MMEFIKDINEARMTRDSAMLEFRLILTVVKDYILDDACIRLLKKDPTFTNTVRAYA